MTDNQFDTLFRKKLADYSSQVPGDMWRRIKQRKDKERRIIILLALLLMAVGGATSYFVFSGKQQNKENIASSQKGRLNSNDYSSNKNKKDEAVIIQSDITSKKEKNKNSLTKNNKTIKNEEGSENVDAMNKNNKSVLDKSPKEKNIKTGNEEKSNESATKSSVPHLSKNIPDLSVNNLKQSTIKSNENITPKQGDQKKSLLQKDSLSRNKQNARTHTITIHEPLINNLALEVYLSPDIPFSKTSSTNTAYLRSKDSASQMQLSYTIGARLSALFGNHIIAKIGLQYSEINEKFNYANNNAIRTVPVVIQRLLADATGTMRVVFDTSNLTQAGTQYKLTYNHYKSIDVPILIGYETGNDRFKAAINTGLILNINTSYNGDLLDSSLNPIDIGSNNVYKSNTGVSLYLGLSLATKLNNRFHLFTEPYIRYRLSDMTGTHEPFTQKINVGGLSFGLRYNFKK